MRMTISPLEQEEPMQHRHALESVCSMAGVGLLATGVVAWASSLLEHRQIVAAVVAATCAVVAAAVTPAVRAMCQRIPDEHGGPIACDPVRLMPVVAALAALGAAAVAWWWASVPLMLAAMVVFVIGGAWTVAIDTVTERIPSALTWTYSTVVAALLVSAAAGGEVQWSRLAVGAVCALVWAGLLFGLSILTRGWPGLGDVRLALPMGAITGTVGVTCAFYAAAGSQLLGMLVALALLAVRRGGLRSTMPMGPPMVVATVVALVLS